MGTTDIPYEMYDVHHRKWLWDDWEYFAKASPIYYVTRNRDADADPARQERPACIPASRLSSIGSSRSSVRRQCVSCSTLGRDTATLGRRRGWTTRCERCGGWSTTSRARVASRRIRTSTTSHTCHGPTRQKATRARPRRPRNSCAVHARVHVPREYPPIGMLKRSMLGVGMRRPCWAPRRSFRSPVFGSKPRPTRAPRRRGGTTEPTTSLPISAGHHRPTRPRHTRCRPRPRPRLPGSIHPGRPEPSRR